MPKPALIWLRRDLRLTDHAPIMAALSQGRAVVPVYLADYDVGEWAPGSASRWWLHHSLRALGDSIAECGNRLIIRRGEPLATLLNLCRETGADTVYWHRLYEPDSVSRDARVKRELREHGIEGKSFDGALLHEPSAFLKKDGTPFRVFTPFWKSLLVGLDPPVVHPAPDHLPKIDKGIESLQVDELGLKPSIPWDSTLHGAWTPGEASALRRLGTFAADPVADYQRMRDLPAEDGVSRLSPYLHFGEVTPRQAWHAVKAGDHGHSGGADAFIRELGWREFAHSILFHFPHTTTQPMYDKYREFPWRRDYSALLEAWQQGRTGYPIVDAGMRELWATGWMHNRVRMVVASLLVKNLRIPWQEGARWFWDTLVDADLANNSMGWQWAAGCGADAAPYFRIFNPTRQLERFDPELAYVKRWVPEFGTNDYPEPIVPFAESRDEALAALKSLGDAS